MSVNSVTNSLPLWALYLISLGIIFGSLEVGWRLGYRRRQRIDEKGMTPVTAAVGSTLGLLAFLLAFTFSMAADRYEKRKQVVVQEAYAIDTTYLRADFLPEQLRGDARNLLREYAVLRSGGMSVIMSPEGRTTTDDLHARLWSIAAAAKVTSDTDFTSLFAESLNETINLDIVRVAANRNQIPDSIWLMLGIVTILSMAAVGYEFGLAGTRNWAVTILLAVVFTTVIVLIADLDQPQAGLLQVSQQPLIDLIKSIGTPVP
jgi:1-acyl-sn-glycerol-3-phosphate acyltransferase